MSVNKYILLHMHTFLGRWLGALNSDCSFTFSLDSEEKSCKYFIILGTVNLI